MRIINLKTSCFVIGLLTSSLAVGQTDYGDLSGQMNVISTAVPFLNISPDSRGGAMGESGAATSPDLFSQAWNPAKYAFLNAENGAAMSFTPWLRYLVNDINMYYVTGFHRIDKMQTISGSLRYFSVGEVIIRESAEGTPYQIKPNEFAIDAAYSRLLSKKFSGAVAFRYIRSDLSGGQVEGMEAGNTFAADVAFFYKQPFKSGKLKSDFTAGVNVSNIGAKISYDGVNKEFIPTNLKLGAAYMTDLDAYNRLSFALDLNKLLVPTPQSTDTTTTSYNDSNSDVGVIEGMFKSFGDAPGGVEEELHEINVSVGAEYLYAKQFALRAGYFYEHETKGNRQYVTAGAGLTFNIFTIDASYIIPMVANNPLSNTIRFSLSFNLSDI